MLNERDAVIEHDAHDRQQDKGTEREWSARLRGRYQDEIAKSALGPDEFTDHRTDHCEGDGDLEADEDVRHGGP